MIAFRWMENAEFPRYDRDMFAILAANMTQIAPTGNAYEDDFTQWRAATRAELQNPEKHILLFLDGEQLVGYFQYALRDDTFIMEEIELRPAYQGKQQIFRRMYQFLVPQLPQTLRLVRASARKENVKSNGILARLGLERVGESQNSYRYRGTLAALKRWLEEN
jgi:RimJ/RimL family protein N-acetyltransferase